MVAVSLKTDGEILQTVSTGSTAIGKIVGYDPLTKTLQYWQDRSLATIGAGSSVPRYGFSLNRFTSSPGTGGNTNIVVETTTGTETLSIDTSFTGVSTDVSNKKYYFGQSLSLIHI